MKYMGRISHSCLGGNYVKLWFWLPTLEDPGHYPSESTTYSFQVVSKDFSVHSDSMKKHRQPPAKCYEQQFISYS